MRKMNESDRLGTKKVDIDMKVSTTIIILASFFVFALLYAANYHMDPLKRAFHANSTSHDDKLEASPTCRSKSNVIKQYYVDKEGTQVVRDEGDSCRSRYEQECLWSSKTSTSGQAPSREFVELLRQYEKYHQYCTQAGGFALNESAWIGGGPPGCKYLVWDSIDGMGNQLISLVSAFVYSLLTNRVLLIASDTPHLTLHNFFCEPFPYSSWLLPSFFQDLTLRERATRQDIFYKALKELTSSESRWEYARNTTGINVQLTCDFRFEEQNQFFCPMGQKLVMDIPWLYFHSHEYYLPGLYYIPDFRSRLNKLFPDHAVFAHVCRYLLNPKDSVWQTITQIYDQHFRDADRRLGIQVRAWGGQYLPIVSKQVLQCGIDMGLLPFPSNTTNTNITGPSLAVLLTSLRSEYQENLANVYTKQSQSRVSVFSPSSERWQKSGDLSHDKGAIIDMWLLSIMDDLITTPFSTFGMVAAGKAGIIPVLFNNLNDDKEKLPKPTCARSNLAGPCFIDYPSLVPCWLDPSDLKIGEQAFAMPELKMCQYNYGLGVFA